MSDPHEEHRLKAIENVRGNVWRPRMPNGSPCVPKTHYPVHNLLAELTCDEREKDKVTLADIAEEFDLDLGDVKGALEWLAVQLRYEHALKQESLAAERRSIAEWIRATCTVWAEGERHMLKDLADQIEGGAHARYHEAVREDRDRRMEDFRRETEKAEAEERTARAYHRRVKLELFDKFQPRLEFFEIENALASHDVESVDPRIIASFCRTTSYKETAEELGIGQGKVRVAVNITLDNLRHNSNVWIAVKMAEDCRNIRAPW